MKAFDQKHYEISSAAERAMRDSDVPAMMRALPDGSSGPGFPQGHEMERNAMAAEQAIDAFSENLTNALEFLAEEWPKDDLQSWKEGMIAGFKGRVNAKLEAMLTKHF